MSIEEKIDQAKGAAKEGVGKLTGDKKIEKEGAAEKAAAVFQMDRTVLVHRGNL